jgi:hypothetical protein
VQIQRQSAAFLEGLHSMISPDWLNMFDEEELQVINLKRSNHISMVI